MHKKWKFWNTSFQYVCQKTQIYTQIVEFTFNHIVSKSMQKSTQHKRKVSSQRLIQACFTTSSLTYHLFWEKKNKYKVEKHHIYNTMTPIYTIINSLKKKYIVYNTILLENCAIN